MQDKKNVPGGGLPGIRKIIQWRGVVLNESQQLQLNIYMANNQYLFKKIF